MRLGRIVLLCLLLMSATISMLADSMTTYTYAGGDFSSASSPYTTSDSISGSFTIDTLGNDLVSQLVTPSSFSFSDGVQTITNANAVDSDFDISTDGTGQIIGSHFTIQTGTGDIYSYYLPSVPDFQDGGLIFGTANGTSFAEGGWTEAAFTPESGPATPEPASFVLTATALLILGFVAQRPQPVRDRYWHALIVTETVTKHSYGRAELLLNIWKA